MNSNPICHPSRANKMKCSFLDYVQLLMISRTCQWTWTPSTTCLQAKKLNAHILIMFNFWCWPDWSMDSNPIHHPSAANKMKCFFLDYVHFWWSARLVDGLKPHPPPLCSQKHEMLLLRITLNFWWLAGLTDGLKSHPPPLSSQKKLNACFWITFTSDDLPGWLMNLNFICHPSPTKKWNAQFLTTYNFWWSAKLVNWLKPLLPAFSN